MNDQNKDSVSKVKSIEDEVTSRLSNSAAIVREAVIKNAVDEETFRRVDRVERTLRSLKNYEFELKAIKPNYQGFDLEGKPVGESTYTPAQVDAAQKITAKIKEIQDILDETFDSGDFTKLSKYHRY